MFRHLGACKDRPSGRSKALHLFIEDSWSGRYWLHVEVSGRAQLATLGRLLRATWLECCGHLSSFKVGEQAYEATTGFAPAWYGPPPKSMTTTIQTAMRAGDQFTYTYDFGSSTVLKGRVLALREGVQSAAGPRIIARNDQLDIPCFECEKPATAICTGCSSDPLCTSCAGSHASDCEGDEFLLPVVNSPRMGVCAYTGEFDRDEAG